MPYQHDIVREIHSSRIVCMKSMGHVDNRLSSMDVVIAGSHSAACAVELVLHLRLRGLVGHAAGPGLDDAGISGLPLLDAAGVPGAAVLTTSAPIADGLAMYNDGVVGHVNENAKAIGVSVGMSVVVATMLMATQRPPQRLTSSAQHLLHDGPHGRVIGLDTITHGDERINHTVICMGSHSGEVMADYVEKYKLRGTITNDAGNPPDRSGIRGMDRLAERGIPAAVVDSATARMGDGRSTFETGVVSHCNQVAHEIGITYRMPAHEAATRMLAATYTSQAPTIDQ